MKNLLYNNHVIKKKGNKKMEQKKLFKILAAIFAMRAKYYYEHSEHWASVAYSDAFDMLAYAANGSWDCLAQFDWADEAEELIDKVGVDIDFWDLEDLIKEGK